MTLVLASAQRTRSGQGGPIRSLLARSSKIGARTGTLGGRKTSVLIVVGEPRRARQRLHLAPIANPLWVRIQIVHWFGLTPSPRPVTVQLANSGRSASVGVRAMTSKASWRT